MLIPAKPLGSGRYGYRKRHIRRVDFAHVAKCCIPVPDAARIPPPAAVPAQVLTATARHCRDLAARYRSESLGFSPPHVTHKTAGPDTCGTAQLVSDGGSTDELFVHGLA
jgi:hypothetical protein